MLATEKRPRFRFLGKRESLPQRRQRRRKCFPFRSLRFLPLVQFPPIFRSFVAEAAQSLTIIPVVMARPPRLRAMDFATAGEP
jgi:hypothetical protein